jgi:protein gp37
MADGSAIEWTDSTWNPVTGCTKISRGCDNCYAERFAERFRDVPGHPFASGFDLTLRWERLDQPLLWRRPRMVFVNSMSDLFHKEVLRDFVDRVFETMERATWHTFQVLTKRSSLMRDYLRNRYGGGRGPAHIWCGVSVEDRRAKSRITHLRAAPAGLRFLSIEPLIGPVGEIDLTGIDWVIVGGESGPNARPVSIEWAREIRDQCLQANVAFFFKQWGGLRPKSGGRLLDGSEWNGIPPRHLPPLAKVKVTGAG